MTVSCRTGRCADAAEFDKTSLLGIGKGRGFAAALLLCLGGGLFSLYSLFCLAALCFPVYDFACRLRREFLRNLKIRVRFA